MKNRLSLLLAACAVTAITLFGYLHTRYPQLENNLKNSYKKSTDRITEQYENFANNKKSADIPLERALGVLLNKEPSLVLLAGVDSYGNIVGKKSSVTAQTENRIIEQILDNQPLASEKLQYIGKEKYYILSKDTSKFHFVAVHRFELKQSVRIQLIMECIIVAVFSIALVLLVGSKLSPKKKQEENKKTPDTASQKDNESEIVSTTAPEEISEEKCEILEEFELKPDNSVIELDTVRENMLHIRNFESYIFNIFHKIAMAHQLHSLALFLLDKESFHLKKIYELFGSTFIKTPAHNTLETEQNEEIIHALSQEAVIVKNSSKKIILPVFYKNELVAALYLKNNSAISGKSYNAIKEQCEDLGKHLMSEVLKNAG